MRMWNNWNSHCAWGWKMSSHPGKWAVSNEWNTHPPCGPAVPLLRCRHNTDDPIHEQRTNGSIIPKGHKWEAIQMPVRIERTYSHAGIQYCSKPRTHRYYTLQNEFHRHKVEQKPGTKQYIYDSIYKKCPNFTEI